jgi:hypothetical protein
MQTRLTGKKMGKNMEILKRQWPGAFTILTHSIEYF